jgi:hypothetical protein
MGFGLGQGNLLKIERRPVSKSTNGYKILFLDDHGPLAFNHDPLIVFLLVDVCKSGLADDGAGFAFAYQFAGGYGDAIKNPDLYIFDTLKYQWASGLQKFDHFWFVNCMTGGDDAMKFIIV